MHAGRHPNRVDSRAMSAGDVSVQTVANHRGGVCVQTETLNATGQHGGLWLADDLRCLPGSGGNGGDDRTGAGHDAAFSGKGGVGISGDELCAAQNMSLRATQFVVAESAVKTDDDNIGARIFVVIMQNVAADALDFITNAVFTDHISGEITLWKQHFEMPTCSHCRSDDFCGRGADLHRLQTLGVILLRSAGIIGGEETAHAMLAQGFNAGNRTGNGRLAAPDDTIQIENQGAQSR